MVLSVKYAAEVVAALAGGADGSPRSVFKVNVIHKFCVCCSVNLIYLLCKPKELTCVIDFVIAVVVGIYGRLIRTTAGIYTF